MVVIVAASSPMHGGDMWHGVGLKLNPAHSFSVQFTYNNREAFIIFRSEAFIDIEHFLRELRQPE